MNLNCHPPLFFSLLSTSAFKFKLTQFYISKCLKRERKKTCELSYVSKQQVNRNLQGYDPESQLLQQSWPKYDSKFNIAYSIACTIWLPNHAVILETQGGWPIQSTGQIQPVRSTWSGTKGIVNAKSRCDNISFPPD